MLAKNRSGWMLLEYLDIPEEEIIHYEKVTGAFAILRVGNQYVIGYNTFRKQWEFPAGGIEPGESAREAAVRELWEETHQRNENLTFRGLFQVQDSKGTRKYQAVFIGEQESLSPFESLEQDEMSAIRLWDLKENIGYVDECDLKIVQTITQERLSF